ncbi:MAG: thiol protease/hemagglutinin PrtT [Prolixibacteraceae bacterium]|nr:thiol protease/hemagglutinin PrtT [Prolixibacteraceae bacterium]
MTRILILILLLLFAGSFSYAKQVEPERAQKVAAEFLRLHVSELKSIGIDQLKPVRMKFPNEDRFQTMKSTQVNETQLVYLFKNNDQGFVLVAGDDQAVPVLGYSATSILDENDLPVNLLKWVEEYKKQIRYLRTLPELKSAEPLDAWKRLEQGLPLAKASAQAVSPLLTTTWNQAPYYNELCPQEYWFSEKAVTGCVATAMAQVMKYHNYPQKGAGIHTYYHSNNSVTYGNLTANFGATTYDWANMPNALSANSSSKQINAVATLMLHCGVGVDMDYSPESSGAWVLEEDADNGPCAEYALKEFFAYDKNSVKGIAREGKTKAQWITLLKEELDTRRPILFAGVGDGGGHAFVADGYDNNDFFHMNWGWGGVADGYYSVDAFNPGSLGTGAGSGGYNSYQQVVIGIKPPGTTSSEEMYLYSDITVPSIYQLSEFRIDLKIYNLGSDFYGELGAAIFDGAGEFVEFIETFSLADSPLLKGKLYNIWFDSEGLSVYPGMYYIGIYYKPIGGNWIALPEIPDGGVSNFVEVEVLSPFGDSDLKLYDSIRIQPNPIITGQAVSLSTKIANWATTTYNGEFGAGLFNLQGDVVQTIEIIDGSGLQGGYYNTYTFSNAAIDAEPGSYLLGLVHFPQGTDDQEVIAPYSTYVNPVRVNVTLPPLGPDNFESNDEISTAYQFDVTFEDDYSGFYTIGTSIHSEVDQDYYLLNLPGGYHYTILARVHDKGNSELEEAFTGDMIWAHSIDGEWSEMYDDEMTTPYVLYNGGKVYFGVIPYFEGQTGSYSLMIEIVRTLSTGEQTVVHSDDFRVFPNPAKDQLKVKAPEIVTSYSLYNQLGEKVCETLVDELNFTIPLDTYHQGVYYLKLKTANELITKKIVIHE